MTSLPRCAKRSAKKAGRKPPAGQGWRLIFLRGVKGMASIQDDYAKVREHIRNSLLAGRQPGRQSDIGAALRMGKGRVNKAIKALAEDEEISIHRPMGDQYAVSQYDMPNDPDVAAVERPGPETALGTGGLGYQPGPAVSGGKAVWPAGTLVMGASPNRLLIAPDGTRGHERPDGGFWIQRGRGDTEARSRRILRHAGRRPSDAPLGAMAIRALAASWAGDRPIGWRPPRMMGRGEEAAAECPLCRLPFYPAGEERECAECTDCGCCRAAEADMRQVDTETADAATCAECRQPYYPAGTETLCVDCTPF